MSTIAVDNSGSAARDFCMLERNVLSHYRLSVLLSLLAASVLLKVRVPRPDGQDDNDGGEEYGSKVSTTLASSLVACAFVVLGAGLLEYFSTQTDLRSMRPFFKTSRLHAYLLFTFAGLVLALCIVLLVSSGMFKG